MLVGVFNQKEKTFQTIAKIGTGLSDKGLIELKEIIDSKSVKKQPDDVVCAKELYPDVWAFPEIVCIIRADEITKSSMHTAGINSEHFGLALRFPRFMGYRKDKSIYDATTVAEVQSLYALQFEKKGKKRKALPLQKEHQEVNLKIT